MFDSIGSKIRSLAKFIFYIGMLLSAIAMIGIWISGGGNLNIGGFGIFLAGLLAGVLGALGAWVGSFLIYGFGQMLEDLEAIRANTDQLNHLD